MLTILDHSPHGQKLADFARETQIEVKVISTPQPVAYLPDPKKIYIGFNRNNPITPGRFVLMLAGIVREAQQEVNGVKHPDLRAPLDEHMKVSLAKQEDKLWYMCTVACELNDQEAFSEYLLLDELRKMGHNEVLDLYLKQERPN